jgi:hypothetical protein
MMHVRTKDSFARLDAKEIDLLCGGFASVAGADDIPGDYEFLQWRREGLVLLTNLPKRELPVPAISVDRLPGVPLIVPSTGGVITDFLCRWYGSDFRSRLTIVAAIDDIYYGLALMRSEMAYGCMLTSVSIARAAADRPAAREVTPSLAATVTGWLPDQMIRAAKTAALIGFGRPQLLQLLTVGADLLGECIQYLEDVGQLLRVVIGCEELLHLFAELVPQPGYVLLGFGCANDRLQALGPNDLGNLVAHELALAHRSLRLSAVHADRQSAPIQGT